MVGSAVIRERMLTQATLTVTSARPPQTSPLTIEESQREYPAKRLSTAPFIMEMAILTTMLIPILPFPVITNMLPAPERVYEYRINLMPTPMPPGLQIPILILLFWHRALVKDAYGSDFASCGPPNLRQSLHPGQSKTSCDDEVLTLEPPTEGDTERSESKLNKLQVLRDKGVRVVTTFKWQLDGAQATFWMPEDTMDEMQKCRQWYCSMWRTDWWVDVCAPVHIVKGGEWEVEKGPRWYS